MGLKLGDVSPLAALVTGEGFATNFGVLPAMRARQVEDEKEREAAAAAKSAADQEAKAQQEQSLAMYRKEHGFKKGGKVKSKSASSRGDGIAQRGKTRGKMY
jgi:ribosomal protein S18 acetylase RimI-like enzyme